VDAVVVHKVLKLEVENGLSLCDVTGTDMAEAYPDIRRVLTGSDSLASDRYSYKRLSPEMLLFYCHDQAGGHNVPASHLAGFKVHGTAVVITGPQREQSPCVLEDMSWAKWDALVKNQMRSPPAEDREPATGSAQPVPGQQRGLSKRRTNTNSGQRSAPSGNNTSQDNTSILESGYITPYGMCAPPPTQSSRRTKSVSMTETTKVLRFQLEDAPEPEASARRDEYEKEQEDRRRRRRLRDDQKEEEEEKEDGLQTFGSDFALRTTMSALLYKEGQTPDRANKKKKRAKKRERATPPSQMVPVMGNKYFDVVADAGTIMVEDDQGHKTRKSRRLAGKNNSK